MRTWFFLMVERAHRLTCHVSLHYNDTSEAFKLCDGVDVFRQHERATMYHDGMMHT